MPETCETCQFWFSKSSPKSGDCRRYAPRASIHTDQVRFVTVPASCYCGDYKSKVEEYIETADLPPKPRPPPPIDITEGDDRPPARPKPPLTHRLSEGDEALPEVGGVHRDSHGQR